jgi:signal transduction histidine kinase/CheY-like chemotaxis protein
MAAASERVLREVLNIGFRAYPRAGIHGLLFAGLTVMLMWGAFSHALLVAWLAFVAAAILARLAVSRAFFRADPHGEELARWIRAGTIAIGTTALAWGVLGVVALGRTPEEPFYAMWIFFVVALFAVLQTQSVSTHRAPFLAYTLCGMGPMIAASLVLPSPHYYTRLLAELVLLALTLRVGATGHRYVEESVRIRFENVDLLRDVTKQKEELVRQKDELDRANAAKTRFLAAASHDLRQPMQAIALLVEALQERVEEAATHRIVASIRSSVVSMSSLLNEILDISRLDAGTVQPRSTAFPVSRLLDRLRGPYSYAATQKYLKLRIRPCHAVVHTDEVLLYRILANLLNNAIRYTEKGGVLVGCRTRGDALSIEVWDTGIGIPADQLEEVFVEFHQLGNPHRDRDQGLGLGLAIVDRTARVLGLRVSVRSRVGKGSVFSIEVPLGDATLATSVERAAREPLEGCAVLIVEDDREIRSAMSLLLEGWKCRVAVASSANGVGAALARLGSPPDLVIVDYRLPDGRTGLEVIESVRARHPGVAAIVATGDVSPDVLRETQAAGHPVLHKPLRPARLRSLLGASLRRRQEAQAAEELP